MNGSNEYLREFGLNSKQTSIYLSLLKSGPATVMNISNRLSINRTTVHIIVEELIAKGILEEIMEKSKRKIRALPPERFNNIIDEQLRTIENRRNLIPDLIESIYKDTSYIQDSSQTQVKYYNTIESIDWLYDQILKSKDVRTFVNATEIIKIFPNNWERFLTAIKSGVNVWDLHIYNSSIENPFPTVGDLYSNFHIKRFPPSVNFDSMDYLLYDGKIAVIYGFPHPHAMVIENEAFYKMSVALYSLIWSILL